MALVSSLRHFMCAFMTLHVCGCSIRKQSPKSMQCRVKQQRRNDHRQQRQNDHIIT